MDQKSNTIVTPKKASTVILLRNNDSRFDVFLLKRAQKNKFMAGNFVYPGGQIDKSDYEPEILNLTTGITEYEARTILEIEHDHMPALAYYIAGIRELFEEAGILFAYSEKGGLISFDEASTKERFELHREDLQSKRKTFLEILREEKLTLALDCLHYYAHWITPIERNIRFDTRFFIAMLMPGQKATADNKETTIGEWLTPTAALQKNLEGNIVLSPPTLKTLEDICKFKTASELIAAIPLMKKPPILPILIDPNGDEILIFPWDPEYEIFKADKTLKPFDNGSLNTSGDHTTRLILKDGRLLPYVKKIG